MFRACTVVAVLGLAAGGGALQAEDLHVLPGQSFATSGYNQYGSVFIEGILQLTGYTEFDATSFTLGPNGIIYGLGAPGADGADAQYLGLFQGYGFPQAGGDGTYGKTLSISCTGDVGIFGRIAFDGGDGGRGGDAPLGSDHNGAHGGGGGNGGNLYIHGQNVLLGSAFLIQSSGGDGGAGGNAGGLHSGGTGGSGHFPGYISFEYVDTFSFDGSDGQSLTYGYDNITVTQVPEPTSALLMRAGVVALLGSRSRRLSAESGARSGPPGRRNPLP